VTVQPPFTATSDSPRLLVSASRRAGTAVRHGAPSGPGGMPAAAGAVRDDPAADGSVLASGLVAV